MSPKEDSEGLTKELLADMLQTLPFETVVGLAQDGRTARNIIQRFSPNAEFQLIDSTT